MTGGAAWRCWAGDGWRAGCWRGCLRRCAVPPTTEKARILLVTGVDYPGHLGGRRRPCWPRRCARTRGWRCSRWKTPPSWIRRPSANTTCILLHFQNWQQPGPGERARENLRQFVEGGKGVALVHFACGAWFGEWPEFAKIAGRAWAGPGPGVRQHDPFGPFRVELAKPDASHRAAA